MIRLGMMHTAVVVMSIAGSTTYAKLAHRPSRCRQVRTPHDVFPAPDGTVLVHRAICEQTRPARPPHREIGAACTGPGVAPCSVIVGPDGSAWATEGRQNATARVDPATRRGKAEPT